MEFFFHLAIILTHQAVWHFKVVLPFPLPPSLFPPSSSLPLSLPPPPCSYWTHVTSLAELVEAAQRDRHQVSPAGRPHNLRQTSLTRLPTCILNFCPSFKSCQRWYVKKRPLRDSTRGVGTAREYGGMWAYTLFTYVFKNHQTDAKVRQSS